MKITDYQREIIVKARALLEANGGQYRAAFSPGSSPFLCHCILDAAGVDRSFSAPKGPVGDIIRAIGEAIGDTSSSATITGYIVKQFEARGDSYHSSVWHQGHHDDWLWHTARLCWIDRILETGEIA